MELLSGAVGISKSAAPMVFESLIAESLSLRFKFLQSLHQRCHFAVLAVEICRFCRKIRREVAVQLIFSLPRLLRSVIFHAEHKFLCRTLILAAL